MVDANEYHRRRLRRLAKSAFLLNTPRRDARRRRWALESTLKLAMCREYLAGGFLNDIAEKYDVRPSRARELILSVATEAELIERKRMLHALRERKRKRSGKPGLKSRPSKIACNGYPSISAAARAEGVGTSTVWMRMRRQSNLEILGKVG